MKRRVPAIIYLALINIGIHATNEDKKNLALQLATAIRRGEYDQAISILNQGAPVNYPIPPLMETPLMIAWRMGRSYIFQALLGRHAEVNTQNYVGDTVLHLVAASPDIDTARKLLKNGAEIDIKNIYQETPKLIAKRNGPMARLFKEFKPKKRNEWEIEIENEPKRQKTPPLIDLEDVPMSSSPIVYGPMPLLMVNPMYRGSKDKDDEPVFSVEKSSPDTYPDIDLFG